MTCCERMALVLTAAMVAALGDVYKAKDLITSEMEKPPQAICPACYNIRKEVYPVLMNTMEPHATTGEGMRLLVDSIKALLEAS